MGFIGFQSNNYHVFVNSFHHRRMQIYKNIHEWGPTDKGHTWKDNVPTKIRNPNSWENKSIASKKIKNGEFFGLLTYL